MAVGKIGISLETHVIKRLEEEAQARGIAKSRLVNMILAQTLPRIKGRPFFSLQVLSETEEWRTKIDLVEENRKDIELTIEGLSALLLALNGVDARKSTLEAHGLPTNKEDRERAALAKEIDASLDSLATIALNRLTDHQDRKRARLFIESNSFLLKRVQEIRRKRGNEQQRQG